MLWPEEAAAAKQKPLGVTKRGSLADSSYPAFLDLVKRQLRQDYREEDLTEEGLRIFTSFDPILQSKAETALNETLKRLEGRKGVDQVESAMVVSNPETGEIQALIGSRLSDEMICHQLTADSLMYMTVEGLRECVGGGADFCMACFDGNYPVPITEAKVWDGDEILMME